MSDNQDMDPAAPARRHRVASAASWIEVVARGTGPLVVLIPSLGRGAEDLDDLSERLAQAGYRDGFGAERVTVALVPRCGHALLPEQPAAFAEALIAFIKRLP